MGQRVGMILSPRSVATCKAIDTQYLVVLAPKHSEEETKRKALGGILDYLLECISRYHAWQASALPTLGVFLTSIYETRLR